MYRARGGRTSRPAARATHQSRKNSRRRFRRWTQISTRSLRPQVSTRIPSGSRGAIRSGGQRLPRSRSSCWPKFNDCGERSNGLPTRRVSTRSRCETTGLVPLKPLDRPLHPLSYRADFAQRLIPRWLCPHGHTPSLTRLSTPGYHGTVSLTEARATVTRAERREPRRPPGRAAGWRARRCRSSCRPGCDRAATTPS